MAESAFRKILERQKLESDRADRMERAVETLATNSASLPAIHEQLKTMNTKLLSAATGSRHVPVEVHSAVVKTLCGCFFVVVLILAGVKYFSANSTGVVLNANAAERTGP